MPIEHRGFLVEPDCERCLLRDSCDKVPPEGNPEADIAIVGMGPGWQETQAGRPFVGPSGQLLNRILREAGLARHHCWVTNVACGFPEMIPLGHGRFIPKGKVEKESMKTCAPRVLAELAIVKPKVVLALGTLTAEMLCDDVKGITQLHGSLNPLAAAAGHPAIVMPLFHPAHLLRGEQRFYPVVVEGFKRAARIARQGPAQLGTLHVVDPCRETFEADLAFAEAFVDDVLRTGEDLAIDIETNEAEPSEAFLTVVGVASARRRQSIAITVRNWNRQRGTFDMIYSAEQWLRVQQLLAKLLAGGNTKLYWNWAFDMVCLRRFFRVGGRVRDGMVLHHFATPDVLHRLDFVVQSKLDVPPWKYHFRDKMKRGTAEHSDLLIYNAQDALYTALVFPIVEKEAREIGNLHIEDHQLAMGDLACRASLAGIPINKERWQEIYDEKKAIVDAALKEIKQRIWAVPGSMESLTEFVNARRAQRASWKGKPAPEPIAPLTLEDFDLAKADHATWYLYDLLRLQPTRLTSGGAEKDPTRKLPSASYKGVLVYLKTPGVKAFVDWAEESATIRTLITIRDACDADGVMHPSWSSVSMKGTRFTSKPNVQNWDSTIKKITELPPGFVWVAADAQAIEYRIFAFLAGIPELLTIFNRDPFDEDAEEWKKYDPTWDAHSLVATEVFGDLYTKGERKIQKALRTAVKRVTYGLAYGAFPDKIFETILEDKRVPSEFRAFISDKRDYIERVHSGFSARFPQWDEWVDGQIVQVRYTGVQQFPPFGRRRPWAMPEVVEETKIRNTPIQLAAGDVVNMIFRKIDDEVRRRKLRAWFSKHDHDALGYRCHVDDSEQLIAIVNQFFDITLEDPSRGVHVRIWGKAHAGKSLNEV